MERGEEIDASSGEAPPVATGAIGTKCVALEEGHDVPAAASDDHELGAAIEPVKEDLDDGAMAAPADGALLNQGDPSLPSDGDIDQALHEMLDEAGGSLDRFSLSMNEVRDKLSQTFGVDMRPKKAAIKAFFEAKLRAESAGTDPEDHRQHGSDVEASAASDDDGSGSDEESADHHVPGEQDGCGGRAGARGIFSPN